MLCIKILEFDKSVFGVEKIIIKEWIVEYIFVLLIIYIFYDLVVENEICYNYLKNIIYYFEIMIFLFFRKIIWVICFLCFFSLNRLDLFIMFYIIIFVFW